MAPAARRWTKMLQGMQESGATQGGEGGLVNKGTMRGSIPPRRFNAQVMSHFAASRPLRFSRRVSGGDAPRLDLEPALRKHLLRDVGGVSRVPEALQGVGED